MTTQNLSALSLADLSAACNSNGNSPDQMVDAMLKLAEAAQSMRDALKGVQMDVTHGRNYQTVPYANAMRAHDVNSIGTLQMHALAVQTWAVDQAITFQKSKG